MPQSVFRAPYWRTCTRLTTYKLCVMGVLVALQIILSRITAITMGNWLRVSFGFLPNAIAGYLLGPVGGVLVAWVSDALGTILTGQAINPGLSLTAALGGFFYGLCLYQRPVTVWRTMLCLAVVSLVCHFLLNTYFLAQAGFTAVSDGTDWPAFFRQLVMPIYGEGARLPAWISVCNRFIKQVVVYPVNVVMLYLMLRGLKRLPRSVIRV
ncbi:MAG: folate family ECF transporter S component [Clostridiales bacterium]|nr:folate family ECF transporter S component [Clostridiales bacterium]